MSIPAENRLAIFHNEGYSLESLAIQEARRRFETEMLADLSAQARARIEAFAARVRSQSRYDNEMDPAATVEAKGGEEDSLTAMVQTGREAAAFVSAEVAEACASAESFASSKGEVWLAAYREAEQAALDRAEAERAAAQAFKQRKLLDDQAKTDAEAYRLAEHLACEAAFHHAKACEAARIEAERKLKAEQDAVELKLSEAEANRNASLLREQANVLLRKAKQKAQERLATATMASKAATFRLQTERDLAVMAEQRAEVELRLAREVELKLRTETKLFAAVKDRLAIVQQPTE